jgi:hypothetical protein
MIPHVKPTCVIDNRTSSPKRHRRKLHVDLTPTPFRAALLSGHLRHGKTETC